MNKFKIFELYLIIICILIFLIVIFCYVNLLFKAIINIDNFDLILNFKDNISIVVNMKNLTKNKHYLFYEVMRKFKSKRNFYFIKNIGKTLNENLNTIIGNSPIKIVQSNFPDSIFLPLVVSLYGNTVPELVLFIEGEELIDNCGFNLIKWVINAYKKILKKKYDYVFGNSIVINGKKIGCSLLLSKSTIIEHLLYYTDSDTSHANPFIQLSLATKTKFTFIPFNYIKSPTLENINNRVSLNMNCPSTDDQNMPSLCIMIPAFKRNYFSSSFPAFSNQTYKPKFYIIIQNYNRMHYNLSLIQNMVKEPVYHIWMTNWNSFFFLNYRLSSVLPCDFILKYDDDQWPIDNTIQEKLINVAKGKNIIFGRGSFTIRQSFCGYSPRNYKNIEYDTVDHASVPILMRPGFIKLDARNNIYRLYGGEDISLCLNSWKLCNVTSKRIEMKLKEKQFDGNNQGADKQIIDEYKYEKQSNFILFNNIYCYLIRSGYKPRRWDNFEIPSKDCLNINLHFIKV